MEKDHFKDRSPHCTQRSQIKQGSVMYICTKDAQKYAENISHLTKIICVTHLSKKQYHPRGLKVKGYKLRDNINPTPEQIEKVVDYYHTHRRLIDSGVDPILSSKFVVGRGVYLLDENGNRL